MTIPVAILLLALATLGPVASASTVDLTVSGLKPQGKLFGAVYADAASFAARKNPVLRFAVDPNGGAIKHAIELPPGRYAIALFQDTKGTGKLESNMFGVPVVPYGFSNNARGMMGPPDFAAASITIGAAPIAQEIKLR